MVKTVAVEGGSSDHQPVPQSLAERQAAMFTTEERPTVPIKMVKSKQYHE
jgi:hypothetical protein